MERTTDARAEQRAGLSTAALCGVWAALFMIMTVAWSVQDYTGHEVVTLTGPLAGLLIIGWTEVLRRRGRTVPGRGALIAVAVLSALPAVPVLLSGFELSHYIAEHALSGWGGTYHHTLLAVPYALAAVGVGVLIDRSTHAVTERGRVLGLDLARGLAVLGMFAAHVGPDPRTQDGVAQLAMQATHGRSSVLFALLAGVGLALMSGGAGGLRDGRWRQCAARIVVRAAALFGLGVALVMLDTPIAVILTYYAVYFLLGLPFLRLGPRALTVLAGAAIVAGPMLSFVVRDAVAALGTGGTLLTPLFTGDYPAATWMAFVIAGLAVGRLDLRGTATRLRLAATGAGLAVVGYGGSWLALHVFGGAARLAAVTGADGASPGGAGVRDLLARESGTVPVTDPAWLLVAAPHSGTPFEVAGSLGVALALLAGCLVLAERLSALVAPVITLGSMSLTAYATQVLVVFALITGGVMDRSFTTLAAFTAASLTLTVIWARGFGRGPMESLLHTTVDPLARRVV